MTNPQFPAPDSARSRLRATVTTLGREIARLPPEVAADGRGPPSALLASFSDLVGQLALGPEPEVRVCPVCKRIAMKAATRCGYCWTSFQPLAGAE